MSTQPQSGLLCEHGAIPLEGVRVDARLSGACVEVTVTQRYRNVEQRPVEAVYVFPLDQAAAVCGFSAVVGGRTIRGAVREREQAFAAYDDAMHRGDGAFLLDQERPNVFTASVGNLRPGEVVELSLRYVALCAREGTALRLAIPTTVSPRYVPQAKPSVGQPDGERVNPEHWPKVPYGLTLAVQIDGSDLKRVESPSHPVRTTLEAACTKVELAQEEAALDRDFVLLIERRAAELPRAHVAREADGRRVLMLDFLPQDLASSAQQSHEVLFLLDCSGSMQGESIAQAKRALSLCIRALSEHDSFNVICFGSGHRALWAAPRRFDQASLDEASRHVAAIEADLGGTEILAPLQSLLEAPLPGAAQRRVLVLTDGQVSNEAEVIALAQKHSDQARIFAFGIGAGASEHLVRGMARASRGAAEMIFPGERIEPKVLRTFARLRTKLWDDVRVDYNGLTVEQAPRRLPPVFADEVLTVFARIEAGASDHVELAVGEQRFRIALDLERAQADGPIPALWARESIRELEDAGNLGGSQQRRGEHDERKRARLVELGTRYGLISSATSFVAIEERSASERTTQPAELRRIPVALATGWGGREATRSLAPRMRAMSAPAAAFAAPSPRPMASETRSAGARFLAQAKRMFTGVEDGAISGFMPPAAPSFERSAPPAAPEDRVFELLMTQRADGSFGASSVLEHWLGPARSAQLRAAVAQHDASVVITQLVIALFAREAPERESEWRPAVEKAKAYCAHKPSAFDAASLL